MGHKRVWISSFGLVLFVAGGMLATPQHNWADNTGSPIVSASQSHANVKVIDADLIRVGISNDAMTEMEYPSATLSASGPFRVVGKSSGKTFAQFPAFQLVRVSRSSGGFVLQAVNGGKFGPYKETLTVEPLSANDRLRIPSVTRKKIIPTYRGVFELVPGYSSPSKFSVVNILPMQDYLKAVVPNELPYSYGYEAVKAQAVAARNYAIHPREKPWPQFDICDSQYCQAYYGANTEHPQTTKALEETQGLVALYNGEPILALYSSSHGGYSENYENAFSDPKTNKYPGTPIPYLKGKADVGVTRDLSSEAAARAFYSNKDTPSYDIYSPSYRWTKQWTRVELESVINANLAEVSRDKVTSAFVKPAFNPGGKIGTLKQLTVHQRGVSGKIMRMTIEGTNGSWTLEKEFVIRKVLKHNGRFLPSANVVFDETRDANGNLLAIKAIGGGFGHGVGMSQLGASYLSKNGRPFTDILQHYYQNVAIGTIPLEAKGQQGMSTQFFVNEPQGELYIKTTSTEPVRIGLNGQELRIVPDASGQGSQSVQSFLRPHALNELTVYPIDNQPGATIKAWVEVYRPKSTAAAQ